MSDEQVDEFFDEISIEIARVAALHGQLFPGFPFPMPSALLRVPAYPSSFLRVVTAAPSAFMRAVPGLSPFAFAGSGTPGAMPAASERKRTGKIVQSWTRSRG